MFLKLCQPKFEIVGPKTAVIMHKMGLTVGSS